MYPLFLSDFNETLIFSTEFRKKTQMSSLIKICPVGAQLFHADGRTNGHDETNSRIAQTSNAPKNVRMAITRKEVGRKWRMRRRRNRRSKNTDAKA